MVSYWRQRREIRRSSYGIYYRGQRDTLLKVIQARLTQSCSHLMVRYSPLHLPIGQSGYGIQEPERGDELLKAILIRSMQFHSRLLAKSSPLRRGTKRLGSGVEQQGKKFRYCIRLNPFFGTHSQVV